MSNTEVQSDIATLGPNLIDDIPYRQPVVPDPEWPEGLHGKELFDHSIVVKGQHDEQQRAISHTWRLVTEVMRRDIIADPAVRQTAQSFIAAPLAESLPAQALTAYAEHDSRIRRLSQRNLLHDYVALPSIPDTLLQPDIAHSPSLMNRGYADNALKYAIQAGEPAILHNHIEQTTQRLKVSPGISHRERELVGKRYAYGRDVKLLALAAELLDHPLDDLQEDVNGVLQAELPSGTQLAIDKAAYATTPDLLHPETWKSRQQLKDRVYAVDIADKSFILKERKTARHTDTKEHGHLDGLTSAEEFATGRYFHSISPVYKDGVMLTWEKPVGYVEFPDGFQFCLFEVDAKIATGSVAEDRVPSKIAARITAEHDKYATEFERIRQRALELYADRPDLLMFERTQSPGKLSRNPLKRRAQRRALEELPKADTPIDFEEFTQIKTNVVISTARKALPSVLTDQGYVNNDTDGYIVDASDDPKALVEIIGFDFEYYKKQPDMAASIAENRRRARKNGTSIRGEIYAPSYTHSDLVRERMREAANYALLEEVGYTLPTELN